MTNDSGTSSAADGSSVDASSDRTMDEDGSRSSPDGAFDDGALGDVATPDGDTEASCAVGAPQEIDADSSVMGATELVVSNGARYLFYPAVRTGMPSMRGTFVALLGEDAVPVSPPAPLADHGALFDAIATGNGAAVASVSSTSGLRVSWLDASGSEIRAHTFDGELSSVRPVILARGDVTFVAWVRDRYLWGTEDDAVYWAAFGPTAVLVEPQSIAVTTRNNTNLQMVTVGDQAVLIWAGQRSDGSGQPEVAWAELSSNGTVTPATSLASEATVVLNSAVATADGRLALAWTNVMFDSSGTSTDAMVHVADLRTGAIQASLRFEGGSADHRGPALATAGDELLLALGVDEAVALLELTGDLEIERETAVAESTQGITMSTSSSISIVEDASGTYVGHVDSDGTVWVIPVSCP